MSGVIWTVFIFASFMFSVWIIGEIGFVQGIMLMVLLFLGFARILTKE